MHGQHESRWSVATLPLGLSVVLALAALANEGERSSPPPVSQFANDSVCVSLMEALTIPAGSMSIFDNGMVRDTIVTPNPALTQNPYARARRCVDSVDVARRGGGHRALAADYSRLAMIHAMIPEYHDEQRLPDGRGGLGPKAHIYASPNLDDFRHLWQVGEHAARGVLVAHVFIDPLRGESIPPTYGALGLPRAGLYCVWLARVYGAAGWRAFVRPVDSQGVCDPSGSRVSLSVTESSAGGPDSLYPPVARFSTSRVGNPLLGVKCLNAWCEIGAGSFDVLPPLPNAFGDVSTRASIKGWHDEQVLSVRDPAQNRRFVPTTTPTLTAALVPRDGVELLAPADFNTRWQEVAYLYLDNDPVPGSKYARWGLKRGKNTLTLRNFAGKWAVMMTPPSPGGTVIWRLTAQDIHLDAGIPGTARFRWTVGDDGVWVPCGQSCCHVEG
jgi:hypothetical protein